MVQFSLLHPLCLQLIQSQILTYTAAHTSKRSRARLLGLLAAIPFSVVALLNFRTYINSTGYAARALAGCFTVDLISWMDRFLLRQWCFEDDFAILKGEKIEKRRMEWASAVKESSRYCGTKKEVLNVPNFSRRNPKYVPSRRAFLMKNAAFCVLLYYLNAISAHTQVSNDLSLASTDHVSFFSRLNEVTLEEVITRARIVFGWWMIHYCYMNFYFSLGAILDVSKDEKQIEFWRPLFGDFRDAYSIRQFWGKFRHQTAQYNVKGPSSALASFLRLPDNSLLTRYTKIFFAFFISGFNHVSSDIGGGVTLCESGSMRFFCVQVLGIMVEDAVQYLWRARFGDGKKSSRLVKRARKGLGYVWVLAWFWWSTPAWCYPVTRVTREEDMQIGFKALASPFYEWFLR